MGMTPPSQQEIIASTTIFDRLKTLVVFLVASATAPITGTACVFCGGLAVDGFLGVVPKAYKKTWGILYGIATLVTFYYVWWPLFSGGSFAFASWFTTSTGQAAGYIAIFYVVADTFARQARYIPGLREEDQKH